MKTRQYKEPVEIERAGKIELDVDYEGEDLTFQFPFRGLGNFIEVGREITGVRLELPSMAQTASLAYAAVNKDTKYFNEVEEKIRNKWLWAFTLVRYLPESKRVYFEDISELTGDIIKEIFSGRPDLKESDLVKKLENTKGARAVSFSDYKTGEQTSGELGRNKFVIAHAGEEEAVKLAEVSDKFKLNPILYVLNSVSQPETCVSALGSGWGLGLRLLVGGNILGGSWYGFALGYVGKKFSTGNKNEKSL